MANFPTYNPAEIQKVEDLSAVSNAAVSSPLEVGSIMKTLTASTALNTHSIDQSTSYFDPGFVTIGDRRITNVENYSGQHTVKSVLVNSLNTGAVWMLKSMGGGEVNEKARNTWHEYMAERFMLGNKTGIEQVGEVDGYIPDPNEGDSLEVTYANTAFGQGMTATPLQMAAAFCSVVNGGTYYRPRLIESIHKSSGETIEVPPEAVKKDVISADTSAQMVGMLQQVIGTNLPSAVRGGYKIGGKTGTAQIARPEGGYYVDKFNGMYLGFLGGDKPEYVIVVRVNEPGIAGFAGSAAAAPIFRDLSNMLIDNFGVTPVSQ
jgi:cell division protein FtsI/penicillin-binding protein 2